MAMLQLDWTAPEWGVSGRGNSMNRSMEKRKRKKEHSTFATQSGSMGGHPQCDGDADE